MGSADETTRDVEDASSILALARRAPPLVAILFACGAVNHLVALIMPSAGDDAGPLRHGFFLAVNLLFGVAFALRWRHVLAPLAVLVVQQTWSHGSSFLARAGEGKLDVASLLVLAALPPFLLVAWSLWTESAEADDEGASGRAPSVRPPFDPSA